MFVPVLFAIVVWFAAMRWRRQWPGFIIIAGALGVLLGVGHIVRHIEIPSEPAAPRPAAAARAPVATLPMTAASPTLPFRHPVVESLLWPYTFLVIGVGCFILCLPRSAPSDAHCRRCHYDLAGAEPEGLVCPECGSPYEYRCRACGCDFAGLDPARLRCPDCCTEWQGAGARGEVRVPATPASREP